VEVTRKSSGSCIHQVFEEQTTRTPEATALVFGDDRWTYARLNARANQIAHHLRRAGVQNDSIVAVSMDRSAETMAALIGILKAGGAYAPLDANDPIDRRANLLAELAPVTVLTAETLTATIAESIENPDNVSSSHSLAYVMFTSGSTGTPKGVMVEHRSVVRLVQNTNYVTLDDKQVFLQLAPLSFDASTFEIWGALLNGSTLAIMPPGLSTLADIGRAIVRHEVSTLWLTAGLFHAMVDQQLDKLTQVRQLLAGGDVLSPVHVRRFLDRAKGSRLINGYGPTEGTTFTCCYTVPENHPVNAAVPIGKPIANTTVYILDAHMQPVAAGMIGELYAGGEGIARGYLQRPDLTAERFVADPFSTKSSARLYRTGDLARFRDDGVIEFMGRADSQIKLNGFRIEPGEVEAALNQHDAVSQSVVVAKDGHAEKSLVAYLVPSNGHRPAPADLRSFLKSKLPPYMVPAQFVFVDSLALNANGKVDRQALPHIQDVASIVAEVWQQVLGIAAPDADRAFFDLGGSSLQLLQMQGHLERRLNREVKLQDLFQYPTLRSLSGFLRGHESQPSNIAPRHQRAASHNIAIVGMAGRFPGANNVREFWENLKNGVESITRFTDEELEAGAGPNAIKARPILNNADQFDASYFGILPKEAEVMDPQHRVFLECSVEALEDAGCDPARHAGAIGVFAGCSPNTYFLHNLCAGRAFVEDYTGGYQVANYQTMLGTSPDFLSTRVSYKLNLTGPSITVGTACSTSLIAVTQACESLLGGHCDAALAGGVSITFPQKRAYAYQEGGLASADGHCRAFDEDAQGTIFGSGCAVVLLKRLEDALTAGDSIYAVIKGYGVNNDGASKVGFTAPSIEGQSAAIRKAHAMSGVDPATITYIEAHGTGTPLGDPVEIAALTQAFRTRTEKKQFCSIGTAKTNVGHLDAAAGVTGLIKTALSIRDGVLPSTLHFKKPNPRIDFANSPFYVNDKLTLWNPVGLPRRAGVSAFGVGGTNAHVILEQAPETDTSASRSSHHLLTISAKSQNALDAVRTQLSDQFKCAPKADLGDIAFTLQTGRKHFENRRFVVCGDVEDGIKQLANPAAAQTAHTTKALPIVFAFPGQGAQHPGMGRELYASLAVFRRHVDECAELLLPHLGLDIREAISGENLQQTSVAQPAIFTIEYALAKQWMSWGIRPQAMLGHSVGEFVAACLADVFSLSDALALVAARGRMMQELPQGRMLSVRASSEKIQRYLKPQLSIAALNSPNLCVIAGATDDICDLEQLLNGAGVACKQLRTSHAFHSAMVDPILAPLADLIRRIPLRAPRIPYVSTLTGEWITDEQATDPLYFARHCRETVQFSAAVRRLQQDQSWCVLEVGPGQSLTTLVRQHEQGAANPLIAVSSLAEAAVKQNEVAAMLSALGRLWLSGNEPDWKEVYAGQKRRHVSLPTYPFERKRYWIDPPNKTSNSERTVEVTPVSIEVAMQPDRKNRLRDEVISLLEDLSGMDIDRAQEATFLEMGFDSLFLTQVAQALETKYGVKIKFVQLLDGLATIERVCTHLDSFLPADKLPELAAAPVQTSEPTDAGALESLMKLQLQAFADLTSRQLELMKSAPAPTPPQISAAPAQAPKTEFQAFGPYKPIQKSSGSGLNDKQEKYLTAFTTRYTGRTKESKRLAQAHRQRHADPRVVSGFRAQWKDLVYPISVARSSGSKLWDVDGNKYIDLLNGFGVTMFGHCPDFVREAVEKQLRAGIEIGPQTPYAGQVAELLCEMTGMERAAFCNTGSEAVMAAIRLARTVTNKKKIVFFTGDYHGAFDEVLVRAAGRRSRPIAPGILDEQAANVIVLEYGSPASLETIRAHAHELAAVLVEPVQSRHPNLQPVEFLRELRAITEQSNTALIFDEVVTGFRTHPGGAQALFGIRADLATYGKVIGGGLPIGVVAGKAAYMDALDGGMWQYGDTSSPEVGVTFCAGTFVRHPLAMASAWAVLNHLKNAGPQLQDDLSDKTNGLVRTLNTLFENGSVPARIESFRSIFYFGFPSDQRLASLLYYHLREKGVHIQEGFPCFLTTAHTEQDLEMVVNAFRISITEMQAGGFLPAPAMPHTEMAREAPLTEAQMEIRLSAQLGDEESCSYNEGFTVRLRGDLNEAALRKSLLTIVGRHEALRSVLTESGDALRILPHADVPLPVIDLSALPPETQSDRVEQLKQEDATTTFDLLRGPLLRTKLVRLSAVDHILFVTAHHMICDGWSTNVILGELSKLYTAECQGAPCELPAPMRFSDFAHDQDHQCVDPKVEAYWVAEYTEPAPPLELPLDRPRPAMKSYRGATHVAKLNAENCRRIKKAGAQRGSTLFSTLLAGFQALLSRLTAQSDIVIGIPAAGQSSLNGKTLVGHCVNFLPIRMKLTGDPAFEDLLLQSRRKLLEAFEHQSYTYGTLVRKLAIPRKASRLPLIEAQFNLERVGEALNLAGLNAQVAQSPKRFVNFDLFLNMVESKEGLEIYCDYNTDLFDDSTIARWLRSYEALLLAVTENARLPLSKLPMLSAADQNTILNSWNATASSYPAAKCVHQIIDEQAIQTPEAIAVSFESNSVSYRELSNRSNQVAHWLRSNSAGSGTLVGISIEPSLEMLIAVLGVLKAGAAYVPLDPHYPQERLAFIREDAGLHIVLTRDTWPEFASQPDTSPTSVAPDQNAYVMYTSGSTGKPKGVEVPHSALMNFLWSMRAEPGISASDKLLAVTTLSFDIAGLELFLPLIAGAEVVIAGRDTTRDGKALATLIDDAAITIMQATPTTWKLLLEAGWLGKQNLKMLCGGEELTRDLANELLPRGESLWNMYGPTETTIWSSTCRVTRAEGPVPIGRPIANTQLYVLDPNGQPTPIGVPGELYIAGDGLARGYFDRPELSAEKFVANPFSPVPNARMYRTGDMARYLPDGRLVCMGRIDNQIKLRGHRIELGEIESALLAHASVRDAAVIVREDSPGDKRLVAYVKPAQSRPLDAKKLREHLAQRLPEAMVPTLFAAMDALPLTPNGKIDRNALAALPPVGAEQARYIAPRTAREKTIAAIWQQVLSVERIGLGDDLFELGADSIHLFQIAARAEKERIRITPKQMMQYRTIAALTAYLDENATRPLEPVVTSIPRVARESFRIKRPL
jgi:amino acid adenylation domain-containing protein